MTLATISATEFCAKLKKNEIHCIVDVRQPEEFCQLCLPQSLLHPLQTISAEKLTAELQQASIAENETVYLVCGIGRRAAMAGEILQRAHFPYSLVVVDGGLNACAPYQPGLTSSRLP